MNVGVNVYLNSYWNYLLLLWLIELVPNVQLGVYGLSKSDLAVLSDRADECSHPRLTGLLEPQHDRDWDNVDDFY